MLRSWWCRTRRAYRSGQACRAGSERAAGAARRSPRVRSRSRSRARRRLTSSCRSSPWVEARAAILLLCARNRKGGGLLLLQRVLLQRLLGLDLAGRGARVARVRGRAGVGRLGRRLGRRAVMAVGVAAPVAVLG